MVNNRTKPLIMCIDDDEMTLKLLGQLIKNAGCDVITAESGRNALEKVKKDNARYHPARHYDAGYGRVSGLFETAEK